MTHPMYLARAQLKMRGGLDLPAAYGIMGEAINVFWATMYQRERQERLGLLEYIPTVLYLMAGVAPDVEYLKRTELLAPFQHDVASLITHDSYKTQHKRHILKARLKKLREEAACLDRLIDIGKDDAYLDKWMNWSV